MHGILLACYHHHHCHCHYPVRISYSVPRPLGIIYLRDSVAAAAAVEHPRDGCMPGVYGCEMYPVLEREGEVRGGVGVRVVSALRLSGDAPMRLNHGLNWLLCLARASVFAKCASEIQTLFCVLRCTGRNVGLIRFRHCSCRRRGWGMSRPGRYGRYDVSSPTLARVCQRRR